MKLRIGLLLSFALLHTSCDSSVPKGMYEVSTDDPEMHIAVKKAHATLPHFLAVVQNHDSTAYNFAVKLPFDVGERKEYIWLGEPTFENDKWYGTVANTPEYTSIVKIGQKIEWDTSRIADWNYTSNDTLIGGYSIRLLRDRMSKEERVEFDKSTDWIIK